MECVSCSQLSLKEYVQARMYYSTHHQSECLGCCKALCVAELVVTKGYVHLSRGFSIVAPNVVKYTSEKQDNDSFKCPCCPSVLVMQKRACPLQSLWNTVVGSTILISVQSSTRWHKHPRIRESV